MWWSSASANGPIGLIAGQGEFPILFAQAASSLKKDIIVFGVNGYTDKRVESYSKEAHYVELGGLGALLELLQKTKVKKVVLAGALPKKEIYNPDFKLDSTAKGFISSTRNKGDDHLLRAFQLFLKTKLGVSVIDSRIFLKSILAPKGVLTQRAPTEKEWSDLRFGFRIAKGIGKLDIGQTIVVKDGVVVAVEAIEGTDAAIKRGGSLCHGGAVMVKVCKPNQDLRFDLPCVGVDTLESLKSVSCGVLGMEAGKTLVISRDKMIDIANKNNMTLVGL